MFVRFVSDHSVQGQGFVAQYNCVGSESDTAVQPATGDPCNGGMTLSEMEGTIEFFDRYSKDQECTWTISCPAGSRPPTLIFTEFNTERDCDYVDVYSGTDDTGGSSTQLAHLSGAGFGAPSFSAVWYCQ